MLSFTFTDYGCYYHVLDNVITYTIRLSVSLSCIGPCYHLPPQIKSVITLYWTMLSFTPSDYGCHYLVLDNAIIDIPRLWVSLSCIRPCNHLHPQIIGVIILYWTMLSFTPSACGLHAYIYSLIPHMKRPSSLRVDFSQSPINTLTIAIWNVGGHGNVSHLLSDIIHVGLSEANTPLHVIIRQLP